MRAGGSRVRRRLRVHARMVLGSLAAGLALLVLAPLYAWLGTQFSGHLALAQTAPASEVLRGFDFGPVYLRDGQVNRYFIAATLPNSNVTEWQTSFEVLDSNRRAVFHQDELHFIGNYQFTPGQQEHFSKVFSLSKGSGYYYFRFKSESGAYGANQSGIPVVEFSIRQGVLAGWALWGPAAGMFLLGLLLAGWAVRRISALGRSEETQSGFTDARMIRPPLQDSAAERA